MNGKFFKVLSRLLPAISFACFFCSALSAHSQISVYIHPKSPVVVHPAASLNIFSNLTNAGTLTSYRTSLITFYGQNWQNLSGSRIPDESPSGLDSIGGIFTFSGIYSGTQNIISINPLPFNGFPNITLDNLQHVTAMTGNLYINNNLDFINGSLILNNIDVSVGRAGKGTITGYSENGFVVTGTGMTGGSLVRSVTGSQAVVFPVGTAVGSYTPASISYTGGAQNLRVRVADNVYNKLNFPEYVYKTWIVAKDFPDANAQMDITLQHNTADEGADYFINRTQSYITRYDPALKGLWDILPPSASTTPGSITDRTPVPDAYTNIRLGITKLGSVEYFSKSTIKEFIDQNTPSFIPEAISPNGDGLNDTYMLVKRQVSDVVKFEVYTRNQVLVFSDLNYQNTFDGTGNQGGFLGNTLPDGIYYYLISVNNAKGIPGYLIINR